MGSCNGREVSRPPRGRAAPETKSAPLPKRRGDLVTPPKSPAASAEQPVPAWTEKHAQPADRSDAARVMKLLRDDVVGAMESFSGPFGPRRVVYADWTASGRALHSVERHILRDVLPWYGNTHTTTSVTGRQSTWYRQEARKLTHRLCGGTDADVVLFAGTGATAALAKIGQLVSAKAAGERATVLVGPFEHHSNILPWRENSNFDVVVIPEDSAGNLDLVKLEKVLSDLREERGSIHCIAGCFSAASNVTGVLTDTTRVSEMLHKYGALACWDYAAAAPYVSISMEGKDAVAFSPHKFPGGPGAPGLLCVKRHMGAGAVPSTPGGGTVMFVSSEGHRYSADIEAREEGGTPDIVGAARCAAALRVKERVGPANIAEREHFLCHKVSSAMRAHPRIRLLGPLGADSGADVQCLPTISFLILAPAEAGGRFLHYNFVCALLNDLFGIQTRGGCMCAGPYGASLLQVDPEAFEAALMQEDRECLKPGWTRFSVLYAQSDEETDFIIKAMLWVADHGWKLMSSYNWSARTGAWWHRFDPSTSQRKWLADALVAEEGAAELITCGSNSPRPAAVSDGPPSEPAEYYAWCFKEAEQALQSGGGDDQDSSEEQRKCAEELGDADQLRWFALPSEACTPRSCTPQHSVSPRALLPSEMLKTAERYSLPPTPKARVVTSTSDDEAGHIAMQDLREELRVRGLSVGGSRSELEAALKQAQQVQS